MRKGMIVRETFELIKSKLGERFNQIKIEQLVAGVHFTAVKLSGGFAGVASTNLNSVESCISNRERGFGNFTPGNFQGNSIAALFSHDDESVFIETVRLAVMNALSAELIAESAYHIIRNCDPIELVDLHGSKRICMVGAFLSYLKKIAGTGNPLQVVELDQSAMPDEFRQYYIPFHHATEAISQSEIIIITGASLANNTLDSLLGMAPSTAQVILVGPTGSLLPDLLFDRGVNIVGATRLTDADRTLQLVAEGAAGFHLFRYCAEKICILNES